jgi:hypothetical protein
MIIPGAWAQEAPLLRGLEDEALSHAQTLAVAQQGAAGAVRFIAALLPALAAEL